MNLAPKPRLNGKFSKVDHWTDEQKATFRRMWEDGSPLHKISKAVGWGRDACSRQRAKLGLEPRVMIAGTRRAKQVAPEPVVALKVTGCQWIEGDVGTDSMKVCGKPRMEGKIEPWCAEHRARVLVPYKQTRRGSNAAE